VVAWVSGLLLWQEGKGEEGIWGVQKPASMSQLASGLIKRKRRAFFLTNKKAQGFGSIAGDASVIWGLGLSVHYVAGIFYKSTFVST
jgi:hypothetical protein